MGYKEVEVPIDPDFVLPDSRPPAVTIPFSRRRFVRSPAPHSSAPLSSASEAGPSSSAPSTAQAGPSFPPPPPPSSAGASGVSLPFPFVIFSSADSAQPVTVQQLQDATLRILNDQISWTNLRAEETHRWLQLIHPTVSLPPPVRIPLYQASAPASSAGTSVSVPPVIPVTAQIGCHIDTPATSVHIPDLPVPESASQPEPVPVTQPEPVHDTPPEDSAEDAAQGSSFGDAEGASWSDEGSSDAARDSSTADDPDFVPDPSIQFEIAAIGREAVAEALSHPDVSTPSPGVAEDTPATQDAPPAVEPISGAEPSPPTPAGVAEDISATQAVPVPAQSAASMPSPVAVPVEPSVSAQPDDQSAASAPSPVMTSSVELTPVETAAVVPVPASITAASSSQIIPYPPLRVTPITACYRFSSDKVPSDKESSDEDSWSGE